MRRMIRDFIEIEDKLPLDQLIERLAEAREMLPAGAEDAEVRMIGDEVFGRRLSICFLRPQTDDEMARDARYAEAHRSFRLKQLAELQAELAENLSGQKDELTIAA